VRLETVSERCLRPSGSNRARSLLEGESSPAELSAFRSWSTSRKMNGDLLGEDFRGSLTLHFNETMSSGRGLHDYNDSGRNRKRTARGEILE
jgi:hypothetical protein